MNEPNYLIMRSVRLTRSEAKAVVEVLQSCPRKDEECIQEAERELRNVFGMVSRAEEERVRHSMEHFQTLNYPGTFAQWYAETYTDVLL